VVIFDRISGATRFVFFTCIGVARRLNLAAIEVKIHMTQWLSQAQEHG